MKQMKNLKTTADVETGFKVCDIIPINPNAVLRKTVRIRAQEEQHDVERAMETKWPITIVTHLNQTRSEDEQVRKRGRVLN